MVDAVFYPKLKGVFAENKRGYRLSHKILIATVASIRIKLLKTAETEERSVHTNSGSCNFRLGSLKNN